jgi:hypothetical protein
MTVPGVAGRAQARMDAFVEALADDPEHPDVVPAVN